MILASQTQNKHRHYVPCLSLFRLANNGVNREASKTVQSAKNPKRLLLSDTPDGNIVATKRIQEIADATLATIKLSKIDHPPTGREPANWKKPGRF
jgi:hypothetical protein